MSIVKLSNNGVKNATAFGSISALGSMTFIKKLTADGSGDNLTFVDGASSVVLDNTYTEYLFTFINMHPATDGASFSVNFRDGGSSYDATKTTTNFRAYHDESDSGTSLGYYGDEDLAQSTAVQIIGRQVGNGNDECCAGTLHLFNPSSTTFVKNFMVNSNVYEDSNYFVNYYIAGYCNVTAAIDAVQFKFSSGNIDAGDICLYGIS